MYSGHIDICVFAYVCVYIYIYIYIYTHVDTSCVTSELLNKALSHYHMLLYA